MKLTFFEVLGHPARDGECTVLREGTAEIIVDPDAPPSANDAGPTVDIAGTAYRVRTAPGGVAWSGVVNPGTRRVRPVRFAGLGRADGQGDIKRIALFSGTVARGEAILDIRPSRSPLASTQDTMVCFTRGARVLTAFGDMPVEALRPGDLIHTVDHGLQPLRWIGRRDITRARLHATPHLTPVLIAADTFGPGLPAAPVAVSPLHRMLIEHGAQAGQLLTAHDLIDGATVEPLAAPLNTEYLHLLFDEHQLIYLEGTPTESFYPSPAALASLNDDDREAIFAHLPQLRDHPLAYGPPIRPLGRAVGELRAWG
ncbi:MAG: Hint domain-containing protein [Pseudomonadota bacterium]